MIPPVGESGPQVRGPGAEVEKGRPPAQGRRGAGLPFRPTVPDTLRALYRRYCETEVRGLVELLPREGRRNLLRDELRRGEGEELTVDALFRAARRLLPLPPYEAWVPSYLASRGAYLERMGVPAVPERREPVTVDLRPVGNGWWASLNLARGEEGWRGHVCFHPDPEPPVAGEAGGGAPGRFFRTAEIFRGADAEELRGRFHGLGRHALEGLLRSAASAPAASGGRQDVF